MKNFRNSFMMSLVMVGLYAQDNNDTNSASHTIEMNVPEIALLDIYDANTGLEANDLFFNMGNVTQDGINAEAGTYQFEDISYGNLYLNYTSVTGENASGFDVTRQIDVQFQPGSTFPGSLDLRITPTDPVLIANGGTQSSAGTSVPGGVALGVTTPIGQNAVLVNSIESVYTGDGAYGVGLVYTLEQNGNFAQYTAGTYQATLVYTLSDL